MKTRTRLIAGYLLITVIGFGYLLVWAARDVRRHYIESMEETLVDLSVLLAAGVSKQSEAGTPDVSHISTLFKTAQARSYTARISDIVKEYIDIRAYVTDRAGIVIYDSYDNTAVGQDYSRWNDVYLTLRGEYGARLSVDDLYDPGTPYMYVAAPIIINGSIAGVLSLGKPVQTVSMFVKQAQKRLMIIGLIVCACIFALGLSFTRWITRPIGKVTEYAAAVRDGRDAPPPLSAFSDSAHDSEIHTLAQTILQMHDSLEGKEKNEQYIQALTHELKTPLTSIATAAELMKGTPDLTKEESLDFITGIQADTQRMREVTDRIKELASLEYRSRKRILDTFDLAALCTDVMDSMTPLFMEKKLSVTQSLPKKALFNGERLPLRLTISNLIQNAVDFTPEKGSIILTLKKDKSAWLLTVEDSGPGIPDELLSKVYDRFFSTPRPDTKERSTGIGLTYVRETVVQHGGTIRLNNRSEGGTSVEVTLPVG